MGKTLRVALLVLAMLFTAPAGALADGIIVPGPIAPGPIPPEPLPLRSLAIKYHHVDVTIEGQVATTHVDQVFVNETGYALDGDYIFPLPPGASVSRFSMWVDGAPLEARVLEADEARRLYEDIVRTRRDPALLEYVGQNAFRARIYPIPAFGEKRVQLEYTEVLEQDAGLVRYVYPLDTERFSSRPVEDVRVTVTIDAHEDLQAVYSPSHEVAITREGQRHAELTYQDEDVLPDQNMVVYYSTGEQALGLDLLSYRDAEDGYLLLLVSPGDGAEVAPIARDVTFVLDVSGSMRGDKLAQAKAAARYVLENLNADDRFNVIAFSSGVRSLAHEPVTLDRRDEALHFLNGLAAQGGTNIHLALGEALGQTSSDRPQVIVFLTDGLATEGEVRTEQILRAVRDGSGERVRLFTFGVGYDVNTVLLDSAAQEAHGTSTYVQPGEDIERAVSSLYDKISKPVLSDVALDWGDLGVYDVYPNPLPDLFAGEQLLVVGRYERGGVADLVLTGNRATGPDSTLRERFVFEGVEFAESGGEESVPRLWATRKIGHLLTQIRLNGPDSELIDEIVALSVRYGIVTPYTSFLVDETEDALTEAGREAMADREYLAAAAPVPWGAPAGAGGGAASSDVSGQAAVERSVAQEALRAADTAVNSDSPRVKHVGARTFVEQEGAWVDTTYDASKMEAEPVAVGSARYGQLLSRYPELGRYLALGTRVTVVLNRQAYAFSLSESVPAPTPMPRPG